MWRAALGPLLLVFLTASATGAASSPASPTAALQQRRAGAPAFLPMPMTLFGGRRRFPTAATAAATAVPPDLVGPLKEAPWRTGLEPAEDTALLEAPTVEVRVCYSLNASIGRPIRSSLHHHPYPLTGRAAQGPGGHAVSERGRADPRRGAPALRALVRRCATHASLKSIQNTPSISHGTNPPFIHT